MSGATSKPKVYCTRKLFDQAMEILESVAEVRFWDKEYPPPREVLLNEVRDVDGLCCLLTEKIDREVMEAGKNLKVISQVAVGYDNIDVEAATERGIYVTNTPGVLTETTADFAWALLMAIARRVVEADKFVRSGKWTIPWSLTMLLGSDVYGKTLGIVGLGRIGSAVARRAKGFNMRVVYYDIYRNKELEEKLGIEYREFKDLLKEADFISIHVPLTPNTRHLFNEEAFKTMKKTAYLINTSRGPVVDEKALYKALTEGWIKGAALDVHEKEPTPPDNPLLKLDNIVVAPHIASASTETRVKMAVMAAENLVSVLQGKVPPNLVNKEVLKVRPLKS
ncbi:D-glycerate dehydrogenase [Candidatus Bathyarchaeota archaeon B24-2]|nr:MAG: D-glycerate dehydrogenase [Candidatus Bathyarchaeota archaeon B24-2]